MLFRNYWEQIQITCLIKRIYIVQAWRAKYTPDLFIVFVQALQGEGIDRHLLGLKLQAIEEGLSVPRIFMDTAYGLATHWKLRTGQVRTPYTQYRKLSSENAVLNKYLTRHRVCSCTWSYTWNGYQTAIFRAVVARWPIDIMKHTFTFRVMIRTLPRQTCDYLEHWLGHLPGKLVNLKALLWTWATHFQGDILSVGLSGNRPLLLETHLGQCLMHLLGLWIGHTRERYEPAIYRGFFILPFTT